MKQRNTPEKEGSSFVLVSKFSYRNESILQIWYEETPLTILEQYD